MFGFLRLFSRFSPLILFLFLESVCMVLIVKYNDNQSRIFVSSASAISGTLLQAQGQITGFIGLKKQIAAMQERITELENENRNIFYADENRTDTARFQADSARLIPMYSFTPAEIINNTITGKDNKITINRGKKHGVEPPMGVISEKGIIGIVRHSTSHFSSVMSVLNSNSRISASVKGKGYFGSLVWKGRDPRYLYLVDVPKHDVVHLGDTVETSGFSQIFPRGIPIGTIVKFWTEPGESNQQIKIRLMTDFSTVRQVYVVKNLFQEELEALQQQENYE